MVHLVRYTKRNIMKKKAFISNILQISDFPPTRYCTQHRMNNGFVFSDFSPFSALSFTLCKGNQAWKKWTHTTDCWIKSRQAAQFFDFRRCLHLCAHFTQTGTKKKDILYSKMGNSSLFHRLFLGCPQVQWHRNFECVRAMNEWGLFSAKFQEKKVIRQTPVPVTSFLGEPVLNLTLFLPKAIAELGKYFTAYPLSDIKGLRGSPGDDWWLLHTRAGYSVSKQKIVYFTVLYLVEVEFSISLGSMFVCDCIIPEGCTGCGYVPNPPETWKIPLHSLCVTVTAQLGASPEVWGIPYGYVAFCICYNFMSTLLHVAETILKNNVPCSRYKTYLYINNRSNDCM